MELKPGYKQTEVGVIPEDWDIELVSTAYEIRNNLRLPLSENIRKGMKGVYPYYGPTKIQDYINEYRVEGEYCLIGEDGDHFLKWKDVPMTLLARGKFNVNNHAHLVCGIKNETLWFFYYFNNRDITKYLTRQGAGRYKLTKASLQNIPLAIPPTKAEQTAIANALGDADALIQSLTRLIAKKHQIKQGAMQTLLNPYENGRLEEGWVVKELEEIADVIDPHPSHRAPPVAKAGIPFVGIGDLNEKGDLINDKVRIVSESIFFEHIERYDLNDELIGLGRVASIGKVVRLRNSFGKYAISPTLGIIKGREASRNYLGHILNTKMISDQFTKIMSGSTRSSVGMIVLRKLKIPLPKESGEQIRIAAILSDMDTEIAALETKLAKYRHIKQGIMQNLLTGRIRLI